MAFSDRDILAIYNAYPKPKHRVKALRAISNALAPASMSYHFLMERTKSFALAVESKRGTPDWEFVPYPASWFNAAGYDDDDLVAADFPKAKLATAYKKWRTAMHNAGHSSLDTDYEVFLGSEGPRLPDELKPLAQKHLQAIRAREAAFAAAVERGRRLVNG